VSPTMDQKPPPPVFLDLTAARAPLVRRLGLALAAVASLLLSAFLVSVLISPLLPPLRLHPLALPPAERDLPRGATAGPSAPVAAPPAPSRALQRSLTALRRARASARRPPRRGRRPAEMAVAAPGPVAPAAGVAGRPTVTAFYVNWDDDSYASLRRNLARIDRVVPAWATLRDGDDPLALDVDRRALDLVRREGPHARIAPLIQNFHDGAWDGELLDRALSDEARPRLIDGLARWVSAQGFAGVVIDFESVGAATHPKLLAFERALHATFAARGWTVSQAVPLDDAQWDYRAYAGANDELLLMAYDQHWPGGEPGPVAGRAWFEQAVTARLATLDPRRTVVCLGAHGYDWAIGTGRAAAVTFQDAMLAARDAGAAVRFDLPSAAPHFQYADAGAAPHAVWFSDALSTYEEARFLRAHPVAGVALWRLGAEDPSAWSVLSALRDGRALDPAPLRAVHLAFEVDFDGAGEILQLAARPAEGRRAVEVDASGALTRATYEALPSAWVVRRTGDREGYASLTFDDGPDPVWTPLILDALRREGVRATFFIIGENGAIRPDLVRRIVAEGHELGNHTYTHPNLGETSARVTELELNATQRLIESLTGRSTVLFRPPYFGDAEPTTPDELRPMEVSERLGYLTVGLRIDPDDWARPGTGEIVRRALAGAASRDPDARGRVLLLHDGGGDRSETVAALPALIRGLRAQGLRLVPVGELAGLSRDRAMPPVSPRERWITRFDTVSFYLLAAGSWLLHAVLVGGLALGFGRIAVLVALAVTGWLRGRGAPVHPPLGGRVSVLVPAFNEEKVIARTVRSLLAQEHPDFEVIVIDDGSRDGTSAAVREAFSDETRVRLITKPNGGKADSLDAGLRAARGEIIVALDADTLFPTDMLVELTRALSDPKVGAVAGNAKVGNRVNLVTQWQALEYITAQNLDRRAFALLGCITVVPGAVGAWRRSAVESAGGFGSDTLAEDQDLTLKVLRAGWRVAYAPKAVAWTEAPDTLRTLAKQRFRWSFGTLQCMWKHRDALLRPRYGALGLVAMPNVWLFQIAFTLLAPFMDLLLLATLAWALLERVEHPGAGALRTLLPTLTYYAAFTLADVLASAVAFALEGGEQWALLVWLPLQRLAYRQVLYWVMYRSVVAALQGVGVGWGKLERKATVVAPGGR
jgi:cellulose synthase/poly-beta-1,6-N-acetylglucosamine synthase-like glycosyltransferase/peptidoglycan/xylan/chitin deacetylase (PgdA/CDA1 family)/spore germination protein YaaH